jgi:sodium transport system ATP-binding protein
MREVVLEACDLIKVFRTRRRDIRAVDGLSFSCQKGEIFGLLGPNGAGKTTTLRMLATILTPTFGRATVLGFDTCLAPGQVREHIGFLATETGLYDRFTARETLRFFGRINRIPEREIEQRTEEIFAMLDLSPLADRRVGTFSTGEKQKLSLARSIIHNPPVLIFDEPTFGLDVMAARTVVETIALFRDQGRTVLLSTHVMPVAEKLCDRIGILYGGQLLALGTLAELKDRFSSDDLEEIFFAAVGREGRKEGGLPRRSPE